MREEQNFSHKNVQINKSSNKVDNKTLFYNYSPQGPCFKANSNDLNENIINIFNELNNSSTLKGGLKKPYNKGFIDSNSESIIDFNVILQFNRLTGEINDSNNFDSIKQIDCENKKVIYDSNKRKDNGNNNNNSEQSNDTDYPNYAIILMNELIENTKNLQATYQDVFNISDTFPSKDTENMCDILLEFNNNTVPAWKKGTTLIVGDFI